MRWWRIQLTIWFLCQFYCVLMPGIQEMQRRLKPFHDTPGCPSSAPKPVLPCIARTISPSYHQWLWLFLPMYRKLPEKGKGCLSYASRLPELFHVLINMTHSFLKCTSHFISYKIKLLICYKNTVPDLTGPISWIPVLIIHPSPSHLPHLPIQSKLGESTSIIWNQYRQSLIYKYLTSHTNHKY